MCDSRIKKMSEIRNKLFDIANSFTEDGSGYVACMLHKSCNLITGAEKVLRESEIKDLNLVVETYNLGIPTIC